MEYIAAIVIIVFAVVIISRLRKKRHTDAPVTGGGRDGSNSDKRRKG